MSKVSVFLEHCYLHSTVTGSFTGLDKSETAFAGITGIGSQHERADKKSVWISGEIISPVFIDNGGCACRGHIEGIVRDDGKMNLLETVYHFPAREGDSHEYKLKVVNMAGLPLVFKGEVISRTNRDNFKSRKIGRAVLELNPFWTKSTCGGTSRSFSVPWGRRGTHISGSYLPPYWESFLQKIERQGYAHAYSAVTKAMNEEQRVKV